MRNALIVTILSRKVFLHVALLSMVLTAAVAIADIETGLVGYYPCEEGEGDVVQNAVEGTVGEDGQAQGGYQWVEGKVGKFAILFDGQQGSLVNCGAYNPSEITGELTVAVWIKWNGLSGSYQGIVAKRDAWDENSTYWHMEMDVDTGNIGFARWDSYPGFGTNIPPEGEWQHVAVTFDGATATMYIDGEAVGSGTFSFGPNADAGVVFGNVEAGGWNPFNGTIDEVRLYDRALSYDDILELYEWEGIVVNAGDDQRIEGGNEVTLAGVAVEDATSFAWEQIIKGDEPAVTLSDPSSPTTTFTPPSREIGYILTFRLTVVSPSEGTVSDECLVYVTAPNEPRVAPTNFRASPRNLGYRLEWDALVDAEEYGVGFKMGPGTYYWFWTRNNYYDLTNLAEGQAAVIAVKGKNSYGEGGMSEDITMVPMRNYALPSEPRPPSEILHVVPPVPAINDEVIEDDNNDSNDQGVAKAEDYWGYVWDEAFYFDHITYFTGDMFTDGGWYTSLTVQYTQDGTTWIDVPTEIYPQYDFSDDRRGKQAYARYDLYIPTLQGLGLRINGAPGGVASFSSISELEVYSDMETSRPFIVQGIDAEVPERGTATLDGSFSFSTQGDITSYEWEQVSGPTVAINNADSAVATFAAASVDEDILLVFLLRAGDGTETLSDEDVRITVRNLVTTAVAGPDQSIVEGSEATLDGSGSVTTSGDLTYQWSQSAGDPVTLNDATSAVCTFEAPVIWDYATELTFQLQVDDGVGGVAADEVIVGVRNSLSWPAYPYLDAAAPTTGYLTELLHLGQFPTDRIHAPLNINNDPLAAFGGQAFVNPAPGEEYDFTDTGVTVTRNPMVWTALEGAATGYFGDEGLDNFEQMYHVYILCSDEREARLHFRHDDEVRGWNNGVLVLSRDGYDEGTEATDDFTLAKGLNSMTFKFEDGTGGNHFAMGITNRSDELFDDLYYSLGPAFLLADAYSARVLPKSYEAGGSVEVSLSLRVNPDSKPSLVTISEPIPAGLTVVDAGGGAVAGGTITWTFSSGDVGTQTISYTLGVPGDYTGGVQFTGTISFSGTTEAIRGDEFIYATPTAPQNLSVDMLLAADLSWSANAEEGIIGYRVYRSVNGQDWEQIAFIAGTSYSDAAVTDGNTYNYQVSAVNVNGEEGPVSTPSGEKMITLLVRQAEDFNYGGGLYPGPGPEEAPAVEAPGPGDFDVAYDYLFQSTDYPDQPNVYRPKDDIDCRESSPGQYIMGYTTVGDWWRYTFEVPEAGPSDPPGGWVMLVLKVASPSGGTADLYWDEELVGSVDFVTGGWGTYGSFPLEEQLQTSAGVHTLRVHFVAGEMDIDSIGMGFNWTKPAREDLFADDFEDYTTLYSFADLVGAGYTVNNGSGVTEGAWLLWNTAGNMLGSEDPAIAAMTENYVITDSDLAGSVDVDEELITPAINCTSHTKVRLDFNMNYRVYPDDTAHLQIAEVDIRSSDDGFTWGDWVTLLRWDTSTVMDYATGSERVDISANADGKFIQVRWHFYQANYDYWFAIDDVKISGEREAERPGVIGDVQYVAGKVALTWEVFGGGSYTVEYCSDLSVGDWQPVPGFTWPVTETTWSGEDIAALDGRYYRVRSE